MFYPSEEKLWPNVFTGEVYQIFKNLKPIFPKLFKKKIEEQGVLPNLFYKGSFALISNLDRHHKKKTTDKYPF